MASNDDPLISALPPATDYLTYLTLLEYQLTTARLPTLHRLLQDEVLTTNIGWDLVHLLLPMLPDSQDCLQDIARLGNPREVILRVADSLMKLEPDEEEEDSSDLEAVTDGPVMAAETNELPRHVNQFNCLIAMLSVLHRRIKTKYPSRFIATSLQAALEAYSSMPTDETTNAILEFLRELTPSKRPALPPRGTSDSSIVRLSQVSAPDPEAAHDEPVASDDLNVQRKLIQFGLVEVLKLFILSHSTADESGLWLALRILERMDPGGQSTNSKIHLYAEDAQLKERDLIIGRICALSRDLDITDNGLLKIVSMPAEAHPPPLDFDDLPKTSQAIALERHGALLLLATRSSAATLFAGVATPRLPVYPDLAVILSNFVDSTVTADEEAQTLSDCLLALTAISSGQIEQPASEKQYMDFVQALTKCSYRQSYNALRSMPAKIVHSNASETARFNLIQTIFEKDDLSFARESAVDWLKTEILTSAQKDTASIFSDPERISTLFTALYNPSTLDSSISSASDIENIAFSWLHFTRFLAPYLHAALNLYYIIISSPPTLHSKVKLDTAISGKVSTFINKLKLICYAFEADMTQNGGEGRIQAVVGEETCQVGMARSVGLLYHVIEQIETRLLA